MATVNERACIVTLATCHMVADTTADLCKKAGFNDVSEDQSIFSDEIQAVINQTYAETGFTPKDFRDVKTKISKLGKMWDSTSVSIAAMQVMCSGILEKQIDQMAQSKRLRARVKTLSALKEKFDGMWHLFHAWFPHDQAEDDSILLFQEFAREIG